MKNKDIHSKVRSMFTGGGSNAASTTGLTATFEGMGSSTSALLEETVRNNAQRTKTLEQHTKLLKAIAQNSDGGGLISQLLNKFSTAAAVFAGAGIASVSGLAKSYGSKFAQSLAATIKKTTHSVVGVYSSIFSKGAEIVKKSGRAIATGFKNSVEVLMRASAAVAKTLGNAIKIFPRLISKLFWPVTALMGVVDGVKGWQNAEQLLGEDGKTFGGKMAAALGSAINGALLGIPDWIAKKLDFKNFSELTYEWPGILLKGKMKLVGAAANGVRKIGQFVADSVTRIWHSLPSVDTMVSYLPNITGLIRDNMNRIGKKIKDSIMNFFGKAMSWTGLGGKEDKFGGASKPGDFDSLLGPSGSVGPTPSFTPPRPFMFNDLNGVKGKAGTISNQSSNRVSKANQTHMIDVKNIHTTAAMAMVGIQAKGMEALLEKNKEDDEKLSKTLNKAISGSGGSVINMGYGGGDDLMNGMGYNGGGGVGGSFGTGGSGGGGSGGGGGASSSGGSTDSSGSPSAKALGSGKKAPTLGTVKSFDPFSPTITSTAALGSSELARASSFSSKSSPFSGTDSFAPVGSTSMAGNHHPGVDPASLMDKVKMAKAKATNLTTTSSTGGTMPTDTGNKNKDFLGKVYNATRSAGASHHEAALAASQAAWETGWGKHAPGNNLFGIKAGKSWKGDVQHLMTSEVINGRKVRMREPFRKYGTLEEGMKDRVEFMRKKFPGTASATSMEGMMHGLMNGKYGAYATDPNYTQKIGGTYTKYFGNVDPGMVVGSDGKTITSPTDTAKRLLSSSIGGGKGGFGGFSPMALSAAEDVLAGKTEGKHGARRMLSAGKRKGDYTPKGVRDSFVKENQRSVAGIRKGELDDNLVAQLNYAASKLGGRYDIVVGSGGQMPLAEAKRRGAVKRGKRWYLNGKAVRTGSTRHDGGGAGDLRIKDKETGKFLSMNNKHGRAVMSKLIEHSVEAGATGVGGGNNYMGANTLHIGGGKSTTWGGAGFVGPAHARGRKLAKSFDKSILKNFMPKDGKIVGDGPKSIPVEPHKVKTTSFKVPPTAAAVTSPTATLAAPTPAAVPPSRAAAINPAGHAAKLTAPPPSTMPSTGGANDIPAIGDIPALDEMSMLLINGSAITS